MGEELLPVLGASLGSGAACWAVMRVEIRFLWRDLRALTKKVDNLERERVRWLLERRQTER